MIRSVYKAIVELTSQLYANIKMSHPTEANILLPPTSVSKMTDWQPELFNKTIEVPYIAINAGLLNKMQKKFKSYFLKIPNFKCVQDYIPVSNENEIRVQNHDDMKRIILDPNKVKVFEDFDHDERQVLINDFNVSSEKHFGNLTVDLNYKNYHPRTMLKGK